MPLTASPDPVGAAPPTALQPKIDQVSAELRAAVGAGRLGVAYSGGVDSAVLLGLAARALGVDRVVGLLGISASLPARERRGAHQTAAAIGAAVIEVPTDELNDANYQGNDVDRCYYCKNELFDQIGPQFMASHGLVAVAYGENADDAHRLDRPGSRAAVEHGVLRPLAAAGLSKDDVRAAARWLGLAVAEKPAAPCLASRIPHGEPVTAEKLAQIETAEDGLTALGFTEVRVRHHGATARIELPLADLDRLFDPDLRAQVLQAVRAARFSTVVVDLAGLQSGAFTTKLLGVPSVAR